MKKPKIILIISMLMILTVSTEVLAQAKFIFSNTPFGSATAAGKQKFKSSEFIYGRAEFPKTIKDFFDTDNGEGSRDYPKGILIYNMKLLDDKQQEVGSTPEKFIKPSDDELNGNYLNFDVSPEPSKASTITAMVSSFDLGLFSVPFSNIFNQSGYYGRVPALVNGNVYTVEVKISRWTFDPYNPRTPKGMETWTVATGTFQIEYNANDIPTLIKNNKASDESVKENARKKAMAGRGLPEEWNSWKGPNATGHTEKQLVDMFLATRAEPAIKVYKVVIEPKPGGPLWDIQKNGLVITERHCMQLVGFFASVSGQFRFYRMGVRETYLGGETYDVANGWVQLIERLDVDNKFIPATAPIASK